MPVSKRLLTFLFLAMKSRHEQFFPELNEPARPAAARPVSRDMGGQAAGGSAVRPERRGQDRRKPPNPGPAAARASMIGPAGG